MIGPDGPKGIKELPMLVDADVAAEEEDLEVELPLVAEPPSEVVLPASAASETGVRDVAPLIKIVLEEMEPTAALAGVEVVATTTTTKINNAEQLETTVLASFKSELLSNVSLLS